MSPIEIRLGPKLDAAQRPGLEGACGGAPLRPPLARRASSTRGCQLRVPARPGRPAHRETVRTFDPGRKSKLARCSPPAFALEAPSQPDLGPRLGQCSGLAEPGSEAASRRTEETQWQTCQGPSRTRGAAPAVRREPPQKQSSQCTCPRLHPPPLPADYRERGPGPRPSRTGREGRLGCPEATAATAGVEGVSQVTWRGRSATARVASEHAPIQRRVRRVRPSGGAAARVVSWPAGEAASRAAGLFRPRPEMGHLARLRPFRGAVAPGSAASGAGRAVIAPSMSTCEPAWGASLWMPHRALQSAGSGSGM